MGKDGDGSPASTGKRQTSADQLLEETILRSCNQESHCVSDPLSLDTPTP